MPQTLECDKIGFLQGFSRNRNNILAFYVTSKEVLKKNSNCLGYCSETAPTGQFRDTKSPEWIHLNSKTGEVTVYNLEDGIICEDKNLICITYDYEVFQRMDLVATYCQEYGEHFQILAESICSKKVVKPQKPKIKEAVQARPRRGLVSRTLLACLMFIISYVTTFKQIIQYSTTLTHIQTNIISIKWLIKKILSRNHRSQLKVFNIMFSKVLDITLGVVVLYYFLKYEETVFAFCKEITERIIKDLAYVLTILMGSPAGLKLNYSFNKTLGIFFFYHIALWRAFIHVMNPLLNCISYIVIFPGAMFGLSYQFAIISDLIAFFTFQVYCIYVYAARLYGVQIRGITSLFKLFMGRKYNPLRTRVDSFQYSRHQLFIGTLGFTILLFLLPTTSLYYAVFTSFRILLKLAELILEKIRQILQYLPVYLFLMWLIKSPSIKGSISLKLLRKKNGFVPTTLSATLKPLPLWLTIKACYPQMDKEINKNLKFGAIFQNVLYGKLI